MEYLPDDVRGGTSLTVQQGELAVSRTAGSCLQTRKLGSGVAIAVYDPMTSAVGLAHVVFPDSRVSQRHASRKPGQFADTAIAALVKNLQDIGTDLESNNCIVTVVGGAHALGSLQPFAMGDVTLTAVREHLKVNGLVPAAEDVAGHRNRAVSVWADTGDMCVSVNGKQYRLL